MNNLSPRAGCLKLVVFYITTATGIIGNVVSKHANLEEWTMPDFFTTINATCRMYGAKNLKIGL